MLLLVRAAICGLAASPRGTLPRMNAAAAPAVEILQFLPMLPPLSPGTVASTALRIENGELSAPVWMPDEEAVAFMDRGQHVLMDRSRNLELLPAATDGAICAHALLGGSMLAACGGAARLLRGVVVEPRSVAPLPFEGASELSGISTLCPLSDARLLVGTDDGRLLCLSEASPPVTLLSGFPAGSLRDACVSTDEKSLYVLCGDASVARCAFDVDAGTCSSPVALPQLAESLGASSVVSSIACDVSGNLYVGATEGVLLVDETGDAMIRLPTPAPATGLCFGGTSMSELFVSAGDTIWRVQTSTQGVQPPSPEFLKYMEKLAAAGDYRHVGW